MSKVKNLLQALVGRRWWWVTLLVIVIMIILARLGFWQLARLEQRRESNRVLAATLAQSPLDLTSEQLPADLTSIDNRLAIAAGQFDTDNQVMLKVQNWQGRAGANLITPLVFEDGQTAVLIDRGWIPEADNNPQGRTKYDYSEPLTVRGYIAQSQTLPQASQVSNDDRSGYQEQWYRVDVAGIDEQMPYDLLPIYLIQEPGDNNSPPFRRAPDLDISEGNHLSYAFQWFIFSLGLGIAYVVFVNKQIGETESS